MRIRFKNLLDQRRPISAGLPRRKRAGGNPRSGTCRRFPFGPLAPSVVGLPPVVADEVLARIKYVPADFGQKTERIEQSWGSTLQARLSI